MFITFLQCVHNCRWFNVHWQAQQVCGAASRCNICLIQTPSSASVFTSFHNWLHPRALSIFFVQFSHQCSSWPIPPSCELVTLCSTYPSNPPGCKNPKWVISLPSGKKVNQFPPRKSDDWLLWKVGFCSFTCRPYQFASDEGICCKLATIAPCCSRGQLAEHPTHEMSLRRILLAAVPIFQPPVFPVLTSRSWCLLIEWFDLAELDLKTYKRLLLLENLGGDEGWWWCWNWFAATVSAPVTFVTFTRLLRISRALLHKFNLVFPAFSPHFPSCLPVQMPADSDCVYRVSNGNQLFAQNIHWLNWISEF